MLVVNLLMMLSVYSTNIMFVSVATSSRSGPVRRDSGR